MAQTKAKPKGQRIWNSARPNGKAWKRRPCGTRHAVGDCRTCK